MKKTTTSVTKKRRLLGVALLPLIMPDLRHVYAGDLRKDILSTVVEYGVILLAGLFRILSTL